MSHLFETRRFILEYMLVSALLFLHHFISVGQCAEPSKLTNADSVHESGIYMKEGRRYRKFESSFGSIFVLDTSKLTKKDIEQAHCATGIPHGKVQELDTEIVGATAHLTKEKDWEAYAVLIQKTIRSRCDGSTAIPVPPNPHLDLGISKDLGKKTEEGKLKVFNRDLSPNLNLGLDF